MEYGKQNSGIPAVTTHRGARLRMPENTIAAYKEAINIAMQYPQIPFYIEMDLHATKDNHLVMMHDSDVSHTTYGVGYIEEMTLAEVQALEVRPVNELVPLESIDYERAPEMIYSVDQEDFCVPEFQDVCTLIDYANAYRATPIGLAIEVKSLAPSAPLYVANSIASSLLDSVGLPPYFEPETPSVPLLAQRLNERAKQQHSVTPMIAFSASGAIGKRDLLQLWKELTPEARDQMINTASFHHHADISYEDLAVDSPHPLSFVQLPHSSLQSRFTQEVEQDLQSFWVVGAQEVTLPKDSDSLHHDAEIVSTFAPLNENKQIQDAIEQNATMITTDKPDMVCGLLEQYYHQTLLPDGLPTSSITVRELQRNETLNEGIYFA